MELALAAFKIDLRALVLALTGPAFDLLALALKEVVGVLVLGLIPLGPALMLCFAPPVLVLRLLELALDPMAGQELDPAACLFECNDGVVDEA